MFVAIACGRVNGRGRRVIAAILLVGAGFATLPASRSKAVRLIPAYTIGSLAAFWILDRLLVLLL